MGSSVQNLPTLFSIVDFLEWPDESDRSRGAPGKRQEKMELSLYDAKFYPYGPPNAPPVFAVTGYNHTIVCRVSTDRLKGADVIRWFSDDDWETDLNSLCWTYDLETKHPLLCMTGDRPTIKILDIITGEEVRTLTGHGAAIQDVVVSPQSPELIASSAADWTIRLWHLGKQYAKQPLAALLAGPEGHRQAPLSISFHRTGRWLLSGGIDTAVCLWRVPELPNETTGTDDPTTVLYPYFRSYEQHHDKVDCVEFYGDLILSKCASGHLPQNRIILWRVLGFSDELYNHESLREGDALPPEDTSKDTYSAFGSGWEQLLSLDLPDSQSYWLRFGLLQEPSLPTMLAVGNQRGRVFFWNLETLGDIWARSIQAQDVAEGHPIPVVNGKERKRIGGAFKSQPAHATTKLPVFLKGGSEVGYQASWSPNGEWCIVGATYGRLYIFRRAS